MDRVELLSPAGDINIFKAVIDAGADAVYFGGDMFGARAYAKNITIDEAKEGIRYAHLHGSKCYLTVNTLLKNTEIERNLYDYLRAYVENGIDAFIVQDMGVFSFIRRYFPDTNIHVSTQVSTCTAAGSEYLFNSGASRVVTAREISLEEISLIHKRCPDLEIESFIHGALCVCYSGQCLMSSILGGRSGNRGRCAQPCRLPYNAYDSVGNHLNKSGNYLLSPKDFCTIEYLPQMIDAGVFSFKIEGRMKQKEYATGVVRIYRHYMDRYLSDGADSYAVSCSDMRKLLGLGNRSGFTHLYLDEHNGPDMITFKEPSHKKADVSEYKESPSKLRVNCRVTALLDCPFSVEFYDDNGHRGKVIGDVVSHAQKKPTTLDDIKKAISGLGNTPFGLGELDIDTEDGIFLPVSAIKSARRDAIVLYEEKLLNQSLPLINDFKPLPEIKNISSTLSDVFVSVSTLEQLEALNSFRFERDDFINRIAVPVKFFDKALNYFPKKEIFIYLPTVLRQDYISDIRISDRASGVIACSMDELGFLLEISYPKEKIIIDHRLYTFNNRSIDYFSKTGFINNCIPYELSIKELHHRDNRNSQMIIYSRIPMMVTANCTIKNTLGCRKQNDIIYITDRKNERFPVACNCDYCYNTIYNSKRYIAFGMREELDTLGVKEYRLDFTVESREEVFLILREYENVFIKGKPFSLKDDMTYGHLKRGVE